MRKFNEREQKLIEQIENADVLVASSNELEIDLINGAWFPCEYNGNQSIPMIEKPLITEEEIEECNVDIYEVFNYCHVAWCG